MDVLVDRKTIPLRQKDLLGMGAEGTVFKVKVGGKDVALKIYDQPTKERSDKLKAFMALSPNLGSQIIAPEALAYDANGAVAVGFTMPLFPPGAKEIAHLKNTKHRARFHLSTLDVCETFLDGILTQSLIHQKGFVVGDESDLNVLRAKNKMLWIDVDSWQFGKYSCPTYTENFLDPNIYGTGYKNAQTFNSGSDWYAFTVMLFSSLLLVHPYGGTHKKYDRLPERAKRKITVFDPSVTYPKVALHPDVLSDDMADTFDRYFTKNFRGDFPKATLENYLSTLTKCRSCGDYFPANRRTCPICSAKTIVVVTRPKVSGKTFSITEVLRVNGEVIHALEVNETIYVLAEEKGKIVLYTKKGKASPTKVVLFDEIVGARYEMTEEHVFVNSPLSNDVLIYETKSAKLLGKIDTRAFTGNGKAVFKTTKNSLFRISKANNLVFGGFENGKYVETSLRSVSENQTWFWVDPNVSHPYVFGFFQVLRQQMFWLIIGDKFFDIDIAKLEHGEVVTDMSVKFSSKGIYLLRKTQTHGVEYLRQELVDTNGSVTFSNRQEATSHPYPIHGQAYFSGFIFHPTDKGIVQEEITTGQTKILADTTNVVDGRDTLIRTENTVLIVKKDRVLEINKK